MKVSATMSHTDRKCMPIIKLVAAVNIETHSGAATKKGDVMDEYFSVAVSV